LEFSYWLVAVGGFGKQMQRRLLAEIFYE